MIVYKEINLGCSSATPQRVEPITLTRWTMKIRGMMPLWSVGGAQPVALHDVLTGAHNVPLHRWCKGGTHLVPLFDHWLEPMIY